MCSPVGSNISAILPEIYGYGITTEVAYSTSLDLLNGAFAVASSGRGQGGVNESRHFVIDGGLQWTWAYYDFAASRYSSIYSSQSGRVHPNSVAAGFYIKFA